MKQLNGNPVARANLVVDFEFTLEEADSILSAPPERQLDRFADVMAAKLPASQNFSSFNLGKFREAVGKAMVEHRERELRQLPASTQPSITA